LKEIIDFTVLANALVNSRAVARVLAGLSRGQGQTELTGVVVVSFGGAKQAGIIP